METFSQSDIVVIEKEITRKSYSDIAFLIDKTVEEVSIFLADWLTGKDIIPYELILQQKRQEKRKPERKAEGAQPAPAVKAERKPRERKPKPKERKIESRIINRDIEQQQKQRRDRQGRPVFNTKAIDLSKLHEVRIDRKTCIYIKPGECPETARTNYIKKLKEHKSRMMTLED